MSIDWEPFSLLLKILLQPVPALPSASARKQFPSLQDTCIHHWSSPTAAN